MVDINDPRPVLRQELARVFQNQRVIRAFEKIFDLIPPEFINQQEQLDAINAVAEFASSKANEAIDAISRLTNAIEQLSLQPQPTQVSDLVNLSSYPALDTSITVSWTGIHTFSAGLNVTGTAAVTGNITATTTIAATGTISGSNLSAAGGANPSASTGLAAVNGSATTYMRSDGAPALSQSIFPTWTGQHIFTSSGYGTSVAISIEAAIPNLQVKRTGGALNEKFWLISGATAQKIEFCAQDDAVSTLNNFLAATRSGTVITDVAFGNATNNPTFTFLGTSTPKHGGSQLMQTSAALTNNAGAAAGTLLNAPAAGNPTKWIPINDNGTIRNIPAW